MIGGRVRVIIDVFIFILDIFLNSCAPINPPWATLVVAEKNISKAAATIDVCISLFLYICVEISFEKIIIVEENAAASRVDVSMKNENIFPFSFSL